MNEGIERCEMILKYHRAEISHKTGVVGTGLAHAHSRRAAGPVGAVRKGCTALSVTRRRNNNMTTRDAL